MILSYEEEIVSINIFITLAPPIKVPRELPRLARATINSILVTLFRKKSLKVIISPKFSKSSTLGFRIMASTIPANQPAASRGFKELTGATKNAVRIERG